MIALVDIIVFADLAIDTAVDISSTNTALMPGASAAFIPGASAALIVAMITPVYAIFFSVV